ncbi:MAG TPA: asparagine synthase (glutamine-hydrolyzing), partial [Chitinophagaceae bacterium]|nr:asparagine synthase (glutamine-hydrolyzing) [Chitinophagaceae bacterium]
MCGISGIWNLNGKKIQREEIEKFNNSLAHRGPDDQGVYLDNNTSLALGHRRLSILDLSVAGQQPMFNNSRSLVLTFNGEIYNYIELKAELVAKGYAFRSHTDSEVILAAYQEWGTACLQKFNGMWAFAIWDISKQLLFISRDRFGVKPLYYVYQPGHLFAFASESVSFNYLEGFSKKVSNKNINLGIRNTFYLESIGETIYEDIVKLKPGHFLLLNKAGKLTTTQWWKTEDHLQKAPVNYAEQVDEFRSIFLDACRLRLRSDVPIGIALSGGLDSSSIYSSIQQIYKQDHADENITNDGQTAFIATFPDTKMDEKEYADEVVSFYNGKAKYIFPDEKNIADAIFTETKAEDFIYLSPPVVHGIYREMRNNDVKVSLDGHGADEMLFGYANMVGEWMHNEKEESNLNNLSNTWAEMQGLTKEEAVKALNSENGNGRSLLEKAYDTIVPQ